MKKLYFLLFLLLILLLSVACGSQSTPQTTAPQTSTTAPTESTPQTTQPTKITTPSQSSTTTPTQTTPQTTQPTQTTTLPQSSTSTPITTPAQTSTTTVPEPEPEPSWEEKINWAGWIYWYDVETGIYIAYMSVKDIHNVGQRNAEQAFAEKHNLPFNPDYHFFEVFHFRIEATYEEIEAYAKLEEVDRIWFSARVVEN